MSAFPALEDPPLSFEPNEASLQGRKTLLVVDDERDVRDSLWFIFKDQYQILLASGGADAVRIAREHNIDAAVVDIRMVGLSGIQTFAELKKIDPAIQVIILTAYETLDTAREALRLGATDYLGKPYDLHVIRDAVTHAMERRVIANQIRSQAARLYELQEQMHNQQLREQLAKNRTEIYASVLHDINGPLTIISGFIEMVHSDLTQAERIEGADLEVVRTHVAGIRRQVTNCLDIARRYLGFLHGSHALQQGVGVNQLFRDLTHLLRGHPAAREHQLTVIPLSSDVVARINGTDLLQILLNLTINAFQASEKPHEVVVEGKTLFGSELPAEFSGSETSRWVNGPAAQIAEALVMLTIRDDGSGIPPKVLDHIFELYFTTKAQEGTGMGLSIVRRLVEQVGGAIHVESTAGVGTSFTVYLPV
ncbi:MAG: Response regulator receiver sensor signal transduction histidine kinase [Verrucomicrobiales bacterium]|nr:Response regulator receiver sensor signal transduction histidine kinase [Verrucomicrobiales bacterium]